MVGIPFSFTSLFPWWILAWQRWRQRLPINASRLALIDDLGGGSRDGVVAVRMRTVRAT
jgi:hypothetical protein